MEGFCPLASGSKGNALYLGTKTTRILIDAGIRVSTLEKRLASIGVSLDTIEAVLITHEHSDHIQALPVLTKKYSIPILTNAETAKGIMGALSIRPRFKIFTTGETFLFKGLEIFPFSVPHDTLDPVGFTIRTPEFKLGICADLGYVTTLIQKALEGCDYLYLEANHHPNMVHACPRPRIYKERVLGRQGHLSNVDCATLLQKIKHPGLKRVYLAHLSSECNAEEVALQTVRQVLEDHPASLHVAYQDVPSEKSVF